MKLKYKLFSYFLFLFLVFSLAVFLLFAGIDSYNQKVHKQLQNEINHSLLLLSAQSGFENVYDKYLLLLLPASDKQIKYSDLSESIGILNEQIANMTSPDSGLIKTKSVLSEFIENKLQANFYKNEPEIQSAIDELQKHWIQFRLNLPESGTVTVSSVQRNNISNLYKEIQKDISNLTHLVTQRTVHITFLAAQNSQRLKNVLIWLNLVLLISAVIMIFVLARKITRPLEKLKNAFGEVAIRNYDISIDKKSRDEFGELATSFEQLAGRIRENERYKDNVLSQFSHEMKSPLGAIKQAVNLLENSNTRFDQDQQKLLNIIKSNNNNLNDLINKILSSSREEPGNIKLNIVKTDIVKLIKNLFIQISPVIKSKQIQVEFDFSSAGIFLEADIEKFTEVMQNIISNAIKFSGKGSKITCTVEDRFPDVLIAVKDEGIGIPQSELPFVFEKMYRASNARQKSVKGTGLGLYIASSIVRAHHGQIKIKSKPGEGTEIQILIPKNRNLAREKQTHG